LDLVGFGWIRLDSVGLSRTEWLSDWSDKSDESQRDELAAPRQGHQVPIPDWFSWF